MTPEKPDSTTPSQVEMQLLKLMASKYVLSVHKEAKGRGRHTWRMQRREENVCQS